MVIVTCTSVLYCVDMQDNAMDATTALRMLWKSLFSIRIHSTQ